MMNHFKFKKIIATTIIALLLTSTGIFCNASAAISIKQENTFTFLRDVVGLDMTKYNMNPVREDISFLYNLTYKDTKIRALCDFKSDNTLAWFTITSPLDSVILTFQPPSNVLDAAKLIADRYENYSKANYTSQMKETLNMISELKADPTIEDYSTIKPVASASKDNMTLTVWSGTTDDGTIDDHSNVMFEWMNTVNGIQNIYGRIIFRFSPENILIGFTDNWNAYAIGSDQIKLSKEQAINLAKDNTTNFSYTVGNLTIQNIEIAKDFPASAQISMQPRNGVLYPHWEIYLPLDHVHPGNVVSIRVMMWDDTGEVDSIHASSTLGNINNEDNPTPTTTSSQTPSANPTIQPTQSTKIATPSPDISNPNENDQTTTPFNTYLAVGITLIAITITLAIIIVKKRRK